VIRKEIRKLRLLRKEHYNNPAHKVQALQVLNYCLPKKSKSKAVTKTNQQRACEPDSVSYVTDLGSCINTSAGIPSFLYSNLI